MKTRRRIRRRAARRPPVVRRCACGGAREGAKDRMAETGGLIIGGAKDPAETRADARAAKALATDPTARRAPAAGVIAPGAAPAPAPKSAQKAVNALGPGRPLPSPERAFFEPRLGADLSPVRLHDDAAADKAARAMDAQAFTLGTDIAFAKGAHAKGGPALMAHELSHVAEHAPRVRRRIKADPAPWNLGVRLASDFGARNIGVEGGALTSGDRKDSGDLMTQIVQNMLASPRVFEVKGETADDAKDHLHIHAATRRAVTEYARSFKVGFTAGNPKIDEAKWKRFEDEAQKVKDNIRARMSAGGKTEDEISTYISTELPSIFLIVFNNNINTPEFAEMLDDIREKSEAYNESSDPEKKFAYSMACYRASLVVMYGASRDPMKVDFLDNIPGKKDDKTTQAWTDWVPGDFGYIQNTGTGPIAAGREGENIISLGSEEFWGHYNPEKPVMTLQKFFDMVEIWNKSAQIAAQRVFPSTGLK